MTAAETAPEQSGGAVAVRPPRLPLSDYLRVGALLIASTAAAVGGAALLLSVTGSSPTTVFEAMVSGSVGSRVALTATLNHAAPILLVALGAQVATRSGLLNIGQEGQIAIGALFGVAVGLAVQAPRGISLLLILAAAAATGAIWASFASVLRFTRGGSEVITTLLLNFVGFQVVSFAVNRPWLLQEDLPEGSVLSASPQSNPLPPAGRLPTLAQGPGFRLNAGIALAVGLALVLAFLLARTRWGFELRTVGLNPRAARRSGASPARVGSGALAISGALAGLAGGVLLTGTAFRVNDGFSNNYGWEGLLAALVAGSATLAVIPSSLLFGALRAGSGVLAATGVSPTIVGTVQALVVIAVTLPLLYLNRRRLRALLQRTGVSRT